MSREKIQMLTVEEIEILSMVDKGASSSDIAEFLKVPLDLANSQIENAKLKRKKLQKVAKERSIQGYLRIIDDRIGEVQKGTMKVGSQILKQLSEGIYTSPAASLKELISNSHDCDASEVRILIDQNKVVVSDNGVGMDWSDFDREFTFISYSTKRIRGSLTPKFKRPIIGFLGIGFVSVTELCDKMCIKSGKANSEVFFEATIDFSRFRKPEIFDKEFYEVSQFELTNRKKEDCGIPIEKGFTEITLSELRKGFKDIINDTEPFGNDMIPIQDLWKMMTAQGKGVTDLGRFWQMIFELSLICPVQYQKDGPVQGLNSEILSEIKSDIESLKFKVFINNAELLKPMVFPFNNEIEESKEYTVHQIKDSLTTSEGRLSFKGYIYSQHATIKPKECLGVLLRMKNVSVGTYDGNLLGYPSSSNQVLRNWINGEIYITEGMENAMNINRSTFKISSPQYIAFQKYLHKFLNEVVFSYALKEYYFGGKEKRKQLKEEKYDKIFENIIRNEIGEEYIFSKNYNLWDYPVLIDESKKRVQVNPTHPVFSRSPKMYEQVLQEVFMLLEIAIKKANVNSKELKESFQEGIKKWVTTK